jgi:hypothetical protein
MKRTIPVLVVVVAAVVVAAIVADAIRNDTWTPIWEMAWWPAVIAGILYRPSRRRCSGVS